MRQRAKQPVRPPRRSPGSRIHAELAAGIGTRILDGTYPPGTLLPNEAEWGQMFARQPHRRTRGDQDAQRQGPAGIAPQGRLPRRAARSLEPARPRRDGLALRRHGQDRIPDLAAGSAPYPGTGRGRAWPPAAARPSSWPNWKPPSKACANAADAEAMVAPDVRFHLALLACANNELLAPFGIIIEQALANLFEYTTAPQCQAGTSGADACRCRESHRRAKARSGPQGNVRSAGRHRRRHRQTDHAEVKRGFSPAA